jgi:hypothetical protein
MSFPYKSDSRFVFSVFSENLKRIGFDDGQQDIYDRCKKYVGNRLHKRPKPQELSSS